jgi:hypothetical protein
LISTFLRRTPRFAIPLVWGAGIIAALYSLQHYNSLPAGTVFCKVHESRLYHPTSSPSPSLVMYVHPFCPCTRASFQELTKIVDRARGDGKEPAVKIVVVVAPGMPDGWRDGPNVRAAHQFQGAEVQYDLDAHLARAQSVTTSGHVVMFDSPARLGFRGGITRSRGHAGDNDGTRAITEILNGRKPSIAYTPVFGCPLYEAEACLSVEECAAATATESDAGRSVATAKPQANVPAGAASRHADGANALPRSHAPHAPLPAAPN